MRLDHEHVAKLATAFGQEEGGEPFVRLDIKFMLAAMARLNLWERGLLQDRIVRAAIAPKRTMDQRVLLAMFAASPRDIEEQEGDGDVGISNGADFGAPSPAYAGGDGDDC